jgi:hypothetical protein
MKKFVLVAALLLISASANASTYDFEGVTVNVQEGCRSASCLSVNASGYGSYNGKALVTRRSAKAHRFHKYTTRFASTVKSDAAPLATTAAGDSIPAKLLEPAPPTAASTSAPTK